jgi:hypothetical protein
MPRIGKPSRRGLADGPAADQARPGPLRRYLAILDGLFGTVREAVNAVMATSAGATS